MGELLTTLKLIFHPLKDQRSLSKVYRGELCMCAKQVEGLKEEKWEIPEHPPFV